MRDVVVETVDGGKFSVELVLMPRGCSSMGSGISGLIELLLRGKGEEDGDCFNDRIGGSCGEGKFKFSSALFEFVELTEFLFSSSEDPVLFLSILVDLLVCRIRTSFSREKKMGSLRGVFSARGST